jgi:hypothetical protein
MLCRLKNRHTTTRLPAIPLAAWAMTISSRVKSGSLAINPSNHGACASKGDAPSARLGGGAADPHKALHPADRRTQAHGELFGRLMPRRTGFDQRHQRSRKSKEYGFDIDCLQKPNNAARLAQ